MSAFTFEQLDVSSEADREAYERVFYKAFRRAVGNQLIRRIWVWDDAAERLATRIPYDDQIVYVLRDADRNIVTGLGVNCALRSFQSAEYGFPPPAEPKGHCEFLTVFSVDEYNLKTRFQFWRDSFDALAARGFHTAYATTAKRVLNLYLYLGGEILTERQIGNEARYFLRFRLGTLNGPPRLRYAQPPLLT